ncbi:MAG: ABC transporter ATP-binding protein [Woeseiaceae bacterium]|nr:ABC transporter ATP-binding protein [Woeseiaceae bacterium]
MSRTSSSNSAPEPLIELRGLRRSFTEGEKQHLVLDGLTAHIASGETVALRGRSGSGKSTLLNLISGIDTPDEGSVVVAGINLTDLDERERTLYRRKHIGFVYQAFNLIPTLSVADNLRLVLELNGVPKPEIADRIAGLLDAVALGDRAASFPDVLSGGEQQRVAIARALCHDPSVILADEPTGNLDDATADSVLSVFSKLIRETGATMIMATHSNSIAATCDRTLELHNGKLEPPR